MTLYKPYLMTLRGSFPAFFLLPFTQSHLNMCLLMLLNFPIAYRFHIPIFTPSATKNSNGHQYKCPLIKFDNLLTICMFHLPFVHVSPLDIHIIYICVTGQWRNITVQVLYISEFIFTPSCSQQMFQKFSVDCQRKHPWLGK